MPRGFEIYPRAPTLVNEQGMEGAGERTGHGEGFYCREVMKFIPVPLHLRYVTTRDVEVYLFIMK